MHRSGKVEVAKANRSGRGVEKYRNCMIELLLGIAAAAWRRKHGPVIFEAANLGRRSEPAQGVEAGFITSIKKCGRVRAWLLAT